MTLNDTLATRIVRVWDGNVRCLDTSNVGEYEVKGVEAFIDKETKRLVIDIEVQSEKR